MAYEKQNFVDGQKLKAEHLNHIESGIVEIILSLADYLKSSELDSAIDTALAQAKASGEFDGADGNGIKSAVLNADYTLTLTFDDGTSYTTPSIRGATGATGADGADGKTPEKGVDYFTEEDKAEIASEAAALVDTSGFVETSKLTLGLHTDGLLYIFIDGVPVGSGVALPSGATGDVVGNVDSENNIIVTGALADGTYTVKYEMEDGSVIEIGELVLDSNVYYSVTNALTNCTSSNSATSAIGGGSYSANITANDGYELSSVVVTMGGTDISASAVSGGSISIASVTGNIIVTAVAEEKQAAEPVTVDIGITKDYSITTDAGALRGSTSEGYGATDFIDVSNIPKPCTINLTGGGWAYASATQTGYVRFFVANSSGTKLAGSYTHLSTMPDGVTMVYNDDARNDVTVTVTSENIGKLRFAGIYGSAGSISGTGNFDDMKATLTYTPES